MKPAMICSWKSVYHNHSGRIYGMSQSVSVEKRNGWQTPTYAHVQADALRRAAGVLDRIGVRSKVGEGNTMQTTAI